MCLIIVVFGDYKSFFNNENFPNYGMRESFRETSLQVGMDLHNVQKQDRNETRKNTPYYGMMAEKKLPYICWETTLYLIYISSIIP